MISRGPGRKRGHGSGFVWPDTGNATGSHIKDVYGPRPFSFHIATIGYDYDFHRGADVDLNAGDPVYSVMGGFVTRLHRTHYGWETSSQLDHWTETDASSSLQTSRSGSSLVLTGSRTGAVAFPGYYLSSVRERVTCSGSWEMRLRFTSTPSIAGGVVGIGVRDPSTNQYAAVEYDGTTATARGKGSGGNFAAHGTTKAASSQIWMRVKMTTGTLNWGVTSATSGTGWATVATQSNAVFSEMGTPQFVPTVYWRPTDTNAAAQVVPIDYVGWHDELTIDRFGNWLLVAQNDRRFAQMHFQDLEVEVGQAIEPGQRLGTAGSTGFDDRSGQVLTPHVHMEFIPNSDYFYDNSEPVNPMCKGRLPRVDVTNNITVQRVTANDPDGVTSWCLHISCSRADNDFDLNEVALTGNLAARRIALDGRVGLNVDNDVPKQAGVYIVPSDFDETSQSYVLSVYFNKSVVGNTFTAARVADCSGTTLWSE